MRPPRSARARARWDFEEESPLRDARGFDLSRSAADPSQLTDEEIGLANLILTNGARLYVDHAHPEYSTPEVHQPPRHRAVGQGGGARSSPPPRPPSTSRARTPLVLYKNNTDNKGASYGAHENYLMKRSTPFPDIVRHLTPFFVSRQVVCGAGRVGIGQDGGEHGFQISQRADYFEVEVGLETTLKRPIVNTRDEPHADPEKYRRLHVIIGDANLAEISTLPQGRDDGARARDDRGPGDQRRLRDRRARRRAAPGLPRPGLKHMVTLKDGRTMTALDLQEPYLELARKHVDDTTTATTSTTRPRTCCAAGSRVLDRAAPRPDGAAARSSTGSPSWRCSSPTATATASSGTTPSCT